MDELSNSSFDLELKQGGGEENLQSQDMFSCSVDLNNKTLSNSASNSSLTNISLNEEPSKNYILLEGEMSRCSESKENEVMSPRKLPAVNTPEKIIFCVDICESPETTLFKVVNGATFKPLYMVKRVIQIFVHNKQLLNKNHEFALMLLQPNNVLWLKNFTRDSRELMSVIDDLLEINSEASEVFNLSLLFDELYRHVHLPESDAANLTRPPYTVRLILFYNRSRSVPDFLSEKHRALELLSSEFFTVDVLYVHEDASEENSCQEIFGRLNELDDQGYSYMLHVARDTTKLHNSMAKLLAHPLQRPLQTRASYVLPEPRQEGD